MNNGNSPIWFAHHLAEVHHGGAVEGSAPSWFASCRACGWISPRRDTASEAAADANAHDLAPKALDDTTR